MADIAAGGDEAEASPRAGKKPNTGSTPTKIGDARGAETGASSVGSGSPSFSANQSGQSVTNMDVEVNEEEEVDLEAAEGLDALDAAPAQGAGGGDDDAAEGLDAAPAQGAGGGEGAGYHLANLPQKVLDQIVLFTGPTSRDGSALFSTCHALSRDRFFSEVVYYQKGHAVPNPNEPDDELAIDDIFTSGGVAASLGEDTAGDDPFEDLEDDPVAKEERKRKFYLNVKQEDVFRRLAGVIEEGNGHFDTHPEVRERSHKFHPNTIAFRSQLFPCKEPAWTLGDGNRWGNAERHTYAHGDDLFVDTLIITEIIKMVVMSHCRNETNLWYLVKAKLDKSDRPSSRDAFSHSITRICNYTGLTRVEMNILPAAMEIAAGPVKFVREQEEFFVKQDQKRILVVRLKEVIDFTTPQVLDHLFASDLLGVDSAEHKFGLRVSRSAIPRFALWVETSGVADPLMEHGTYTHGQASGIVGCMRGNPKFYGRTFFKAWDRQKGLPIELLVSADVNPYGVRNMASFRKPMAYEESGGHVNAPESRVCMVDSYNWIGPFARDVHRLTSTTSEAYDESFAQNLQEWKKTDEGTLKGQLSGRFAFDTFGFGQKRKEDLELMREHQIKVEAEAFPSLSSMLMTRARKIARKATGWEQCAI